MNNFENKKWRIGLDEALPNDKFTADLGNFSHPVNTSNPDWLNHHKGEITPALQARVLTTANSSLKIELSVRDLAFEYEMIAQIAPALQPSSGDSIYGLFIAKYRPAHMPHVIVEQITPNQVAAFQKSYVPYRHCLLHEITMRVFTTIFSGTDGDDFSAYGIWNDLDHPEKEMYVEGRFDWFSAWEKYETIGSHTPYQGYIFGPLGMAYDPENDGVAEYVHASLMASETDISLYNSDAPSVSETDEIPTDFFGAEYKIEPCWKEQRPIIYHQRNRAKYWVEETRCKSCGQRIIIHLNKAQCPNGAPDVSIKCATCKNLFQFH